MARVEELFHAAAAMTPEQRTRFLDEACADDPTVRAEVQLLLAQDGAGTRGVLALRLGGDGAGEAERESAPERVGPYRVVKLLGEGGMGRVFEAEQTTPRRRVAMKLMSAWGVGSSGREAHRRFIRESQFLAGLKHPGIAQIYDAGTAADEQGRQHDYIVMELVEGMPLTVFARERGLKLRERVELVAKVSDAVQHAHERGIIHRDLKPANILVEGETGGSAVPKVLDFGIARPALSSDKTMATEAGQILGTLAYMSPEQVAGDPGEMDTRSDVYAIGVMLYELLAGVAPHSVEGRSVAEAARIIRDVEPRRLGALKRELRGDLETIAARAMAKVKSRRYASAAEVGAELRRWLAGDPIEARRDSFGYVLARQISKHRAVSAALLAVVVLVVGSGVMFAIMADRNGQLANQRLQEFERAELQRAAADAQRQRADEQLLLSDVERGKLLTVNRSTRAAGDILWGALQRKPASEEAYWALWQWLARRPISRVANLQFLPSCVAVSADGRSIAVGENLAGASRPGGSRVFVLDSSDLTVQAVFEGFGRIVRDVEFSPDGARLAIVDGADRVRLAAVSPGSVETFVLCEPGASNVRWCDQGRSVIVASDGGRVERIDVVSGSVSWSVELCEECETWRGYFDSLCVNDQVGLVAGCLRGGVMAVHRLDDGRPSWSVRSTEAVGASLGPVGRDDGRGPTVKALALSPSGAEMVTVDAGGAIRFLDPRTGDIRRTGTIGRNERYTARFVDEATVIVDGAAVVEVDVATAKARANIVECEGESFTTAAVPGTDTMVMIGQDQRLLMADGRAERAISRLSLPATVIWAKLHRLADGRTLAAEGTSLDETQLTFIETPGLKMTATKKFPPYTRFSFSPDGRRMIASLFGQVAQVFDVSTLKQVAKLDDQEKSIEKILFCGDGTRVLAAASNGTLVAFDARSTAEVWPVVGRVAGVGAGGSDWQPLDRGVLLRRYRDGEFVAIDAASMTVLATPDERASIGAGRRLIAAFSNVNVVGLPGLNIERQFTEHNGTITAMALSETGDLAASGADDRTVAMWSASTGHGLATLGRFPTRARSIVFDTQGRFVTVLCEDGALHRFDLDAYSTHFAAQARFIAPRGTEGDALRAVADEVEKNAAARRGN